MREIKFRAWDKQYKEMVVVDGLVPSIAGFNVLHGNAECIQNKDMVLMQYTGLKDKNGKEICEGDIILDYFENGGKSSPLEVKFHNGAFKSYLEGCYFEFQKSCEVIGNIYENPELLTNPN